MKIPDFVISWILFLILATFIITLIGHPVWVSLIVGIMLIISGFIVMAQRKD